TQALLSDADNDAALCAQLLRTACTVSDISGIMDAGAFGQGVAQWVEHCIATVENTEGAAEQYGDSDAIRARIATALTETIWTLCIEWEPDAADDGDTRWDDERLVRLEQSKQLAVVAKALLSTGVISVDLAKERLDADFLEQIGTIPSAATFTRKCIRLNTSLNFKQTKFNLISEQNEGFAKLVVLIQGAMEAIAPSQLTGDIMDTIRAGLASEGHGTVVLRALRSLDSLQKHVHRLLADILRLIGVFNIDPNRAVDIVLDCFMSSVRFYWPFYIALLDASPWCQSAAESLKVAQLVGWKMQFYAGETATAAKFMDELSTMAALLVAHGLVKLGDLYPMLTPVRNEDMDKEFSAWSTVLKEKHTMGGGSRLAEMGGLEELGDSGEPNKAAQAVAAVDGCGEWANQHALLCAKLLSIGDTENGLVYIQRFPSLARVHSQIADLVLRIVGVAVDDLYRNTNCVRAPVKPYLRLNTDAALPAVSSPSANAWGLPQPQPHSASDAHASRRNHVLSPPAAGSEDVFFYEEFWQLEAAKLLPRASSLASMPRELAPWLNVAFTRLHRLPALLTRLMRLCRYGLQHQTDEENTWLGVLRAWILPAYSFAAPSAGLSNELWLVVSMLPLAKRYALYRDWSDILTGNHPALPHTTAGNPGDSSRSMDMAMSLDDVLDDSSFDDAVGALHAQTSYVEIEALGLEVRRQVRSMMRRLSGDTVKLIGRQLCALCHPTPTLSLKIVLDQVCSYDNLVDSVVEAFRYLTPLDADVMFYVVLMTLDDPSSSRVKDDAVNAAHWLQSLSLFVAAFSHRHENPSLGYVLGYVLKQVVRMVHTEDAPPVFETTVLSDTILRLAAIDVMANATDDQVLALQGGYHLHLEAFSMVSPWVLPQDATLDAVLAASTSCRLTRRLAQWLTSIIAGKDQALPLAVAMCIHADKVLKLTSLPLSNVLVIYDREIERVYQLFNLLYTNLKPERYARVVPGPHVLASEYGLSWGLAILWGRPNISRRLVQDLKRWEETGETINVQIVERSVPSECHTPDARPTSRACSGDGSREDSSKATAHGVAQPSAHPDEAINIEIVDTVAIVTAALKAAEADDAAVDAEQAVKVEPAKGTMAKLPNTDSGSKMDVDEKDDAVPRIVADLQFEAPLLPREYVEYVAQTLPPAAIEAGLSPEFAAVFWTLSLYDIEVPSDRYAKEVEIQTQFTKRIDGLTKLAHGSRSKAAGLAQARVRASAAIENLNKEMLEQKQHVSRIRRWLIAQKDYWFCMAHEQRRLVTQALLQHCVLPRAVLSASDASFCAKFLWMMHYPLATNKFSLMIVYDQIFGESLSTLLAAFTENEARNYAKFLNSSLTFLAPLHKTEANYKERAVNSWRGLTGFQQQWRYERGYLPPKSRTILQQMPAKPSESSGDERRIKPSCTMLAYDDFRTVMRKWQVNLTKAFIVALDSKRNDTVRNGILALKEMQKSFPVILQYGQRIMAKVDEVATGRASENNQPENAGSPDSDKNLKVMAASYGAYLRMAKKGWIPEASYYSMPPRSASTQSTTRQSSHESIGSVGSLTESAGGRGSARSGTQAKADGSQRSRQKPTASRSSSGGQVAAAAIVAATAGATRTASASSSGSVQMTTRTRSSQRQGREDSAVRNGSQGTGRDYEQEGGRVRERDGNWSRGRDRQRRESPAQNERGEERQGGHTPKRPRDEAAGSSRQEPPRQRLATPSTVESRANPQAVPRQQQQQQQSTPSASKPYSEEADRKRKALRAQLLKDQKEKQKQASPASDAPS
ncbi:THO2 plays a role in transcriptional elongation, partial [Coemansia sp. RSA 2704]